MSTATADPPVVQAPDKAITYLAYRDELNLVKRRELAQLGPGGEITGVIAGERIKFTDGRLKVMPGGKVQDATGALLDADEVILFLEGHRLFGNKTDGFWRHEEAAPAPSEAEMNLLMELAMDLDAPGLERLIATEQAGWDRQAIVGPASRQLEAVQRKIGEIQGAKKKQPVEAPTAQSKPEAN